MKKVLSLFNASPVRVDYADSADLFRVLCAGLIAWFHIWQQSWQNPNIVWGRTTIELYPLVTCGYLFVDSMILLSGFLMMLGKLNGRVRSKRSFYTARIARIVPCYFLFLAIQLFFFIIPEGGFGSLTNGIIDITSHLTFTQNLFPEGYLYTKFNGVLWTLAVEFQFYLIFPALSEVFKKRPIRTWCAMVAFGFLARWYVARYFSADTSLYFNRLPAMFDIYANGMMGAVIWVRLSKKEPSAIRAWISTILMVLAFIWVYKISQYQRSFADLADIRQSQMDCRFPLACAGTIILITAGRSIKLIRKLFSNPITRFLSGVSFNFYMWHQFLSLYLKRWHIPPYVSEYPNMNSESPWQTLYSLACFGFGLLIAAILTYLVEKPCAKAIKKLFARSKERRQPQINEQSA